MLIKSPLRRRIAGAYILLAVALTACFSGLTFLTVRSIEDQLVNQRLEMVADKLIDDHLRGQDHHLPGYPTVLDGAELTPLMRSLPEGIHEVEQDGAALHILVLDRAGQRFVVRDDESDYERIERRVYMGLSGASFLCICLAALLGLSTASRVIAPVTRLADAVRTQRLTPELARPLPDDELGTLARAFAERSAQMQGFLLREQWFTGDVSHELRTPLTVMLGAAELLKARLDAQPDLQEVAERIRRAAADTAERVTALLLLSRSPEDLDAPATDLVPLVAQEVERCRPLLRAKPVELRLSAAQPQVWVCARPELAAIALGNLIRNACQFTEQGEVRVIVGPDRVVVEDTGCGIPLAVQSQMFERFVRGDSGHIEGSGLGLAIVRRVAEHLAWKVELETPEGGGSRFIVKFG